jgi:hypothetical protein
MESAAFLPAPMAKITVAAPVTISPPAQTPFLVVFSRFRIRLDIPPLIQRKVRRGLGQQGIGTRANCHDDKVGVQVKFRAFDGDRSASGRNRRVLPTPFLGIPFRSVAPCHHL